MKYIPTFLLYFCSVLFFKAHGQQSSYEFTYQVTYKAITTHKSYKLFNFTVLTDGKNSLGQWSNGIKLDSIASIRTIENEDVGKYKDYDRYSIETNDGGIRFYEVIGNDIFTYTEDLCLNWSLKNESKIINGYSCKKAELNYGGRHWVAWYTIDIPLAVGPYKFYGLPGLIVKIGDETHSYNFELLESKKSKRQKFKRTVFSLGEGKPIETDRISFLKHRHKFQSLTFNEAIKYMNRNKEGDFGIKIFSEDGDTKSFREYSDENNLNFIEIDYIDN